jgi:ABC-type multidrug transport system fused ATPase/permease subunit
MNMGFSIFSNSCVMIATQPLVVVALLPASYVYSKILVFFNAANREVKRVDNINKSPVFSVLTEVLEGAKSIRAYNRAEAVMKQALDRIDAVFSSSYLQQICNRWLGIRLEYLGNCIITTIALAGVLTKTLAFGIQDVGMISLGITVSMSITSQMNWLVRQTAAVEAGMNSVERLVHYAENVSNEDFWLYDNSHVNPLGALQPADLSIEFQNVHLRYRDQLPLVLKGVTFSIKPKSKVGIIGRSGSGKSTTLQAFLRIVDPVEGNVLIGGVPARDLSLSHLRSLFALIPQDPVLFEGSLRMNMSPFDQHTDTEIVDALRQVGLWERVEKEGGVACAVAERGENFSVGQRQLLCLARALLKKNIGFILMDEATANIDSESDERIQSVVRQAFRNYTVITIAHRLETVIDCDQLIVMKSGAVAEQGSPSVLAQKSGSEFKAMLEAVDPELRAQLMKKLA